MLSAKLKLSSAVAMTTLFIACSGNVPPTGDGGLSEGGQPSPIDGSVGVDAASSTEAGPGDGGLPVCEPGVYLFCRCTDRSEGRKLCRSDGRTFEPCENDNGPCGP